MERIHPNLSYAATCALMVLALGFSGCRSSSSGVAGSPFMSPDRVPPPNTRMLAPGQAQPYYQGDPLPPMQSAANQPADGIATLPREAETLTTSGRTLTWSQSGGANPASASTGMVAASPAVSTPQPHLQSPPEPQSVVAANEAAVAVPADDDPLRFPLLTQAPPENVAPIASATPAAPQSQPIQAVAMQPQPGIVQASYTTPIPSAQPLPANTPSMINPQPTTSPWRSPQITSSTGVTQPLNLPAPPMLPANTVAATIRAVDSPTRSGDPMPRIRVPGYMGTETSADGFRPRTSMQ